MTAHNSFSGILLFVLSLLLFEHISAQADSSLVTVGDTLQKRTVSKLINTAYSKQKQDLLTGSAVRIDIEKIQKESNVDVLTAFQILYPGIRIFHDYESNTLKIFTNSISAITNVEPLYIVDGLPVTRIDFLSPDNIESITVVKDGVYVALYGGREANGVVVITTKKGYAEAGKKELHTAFNSYLNSGGSHNHVLDLRGGTDRISFNLGVSYNGTFGDTVSYKAKRLTYHLNSEYVLLQRKNRNVLLLGENLSYSKSRNLLNSIPVDSGDDDKMDDNVIGNYYMEFQPVKNLLYNFSCGTHLVNGNFDELFSNVLFSSHSNYDIEYRKGYYNTLSYGFDILKKHHISSILGYNSEIIRYTVSEPTIATTYFQPAYNNTKEISIKTFFGQLSYNYKDKYLLDFVFQREGASLYKSGFNMVTYFPAISGAWVVSNEKFMQNISGIYSKIHAGWRKDGGEKFVVGMDFNVFHDKLQSTINWNKKVIWMIDSTSLFNEGAERRSNALEILIKYQNKKGDFSYSVSGSFVYEKVEIKESNSGTHTSPGGYVSTSHFPYELLWGYYVDPDDMYFQSWEEIDEYASYVQGNVAPGDFKVVDINGDNRISSEDMRVIGNANPDYVVGLQINLAYKGIYFQALGKGAFGHQVFNSNKYLMDYSQNANTLVSSAYIEEGDYFSLENITLGYNFSDIMKNRGSKLGLRTYVSFSNLITFTNYSGFDPEVGGVFYPESTTSNAYYRSRGLIVGVNFTF